MTDNDPGVLAREIREHIKRDGKTGCALVATTWLEALAAYLESRAPVGVTVGEPALTRLEVTDEMVDRAAKALVQYDIDHPEHPEWKQLPWDDLTGWEREEWRGMARAVLTAALQACEAGGSPSSPIQTSELEEAGNIALGNSLK
jgi:hypothetical protein